MSNPLIVAYHFPPIGGAGSQRWLKLAKYLPESGLSIETVNVITGSGQSTDLWSPIDDTLDKELPLEVRVHRVSEPEPGETRRQLRAERWLLVDTVWSRWWVEGVTEAGLKLGPEIAVIVASMPPFISAQAAAVLSRKLGKPWVADLRDPWALDEMLVYPTGIHRRADRRRMRLLLRTAAAIVTTTPEAARRIAEGFPELAGTSIVSIPNGFDPVDFDGPEPARDDRTFRIVHTGYLHTGLGLNQRRGGMRQRLGGSWRGADLLTRSHVYILEAIEDLKIRRPDLGEAVELHLAGALSDADREVARTSPAVRLHGYVSHSEAVDLMRSADLLFLPMQKMPAGTRSGIVPGKTYEYLAAGRPILGAVPEGDTREILHAAGNAYVCEPDDVQAMTRAIESERERRRAVGAAPFAASPDVLERFERRTQARRYAELLDAVTNEPPRESATDPAADSIRTRTTGEEAGFPAGR